MHTSTFRLACTHVSVPLSPHSGSLPCSRLCCIFQTAAVTAAAAGLFPAGSWASYRGPDAENGSLRKEHGCLLVAVALGRPRIPFGVLRGARGRITVEGRSEASFVFASNPGSAADCGLGHVTPQFSSAGWRDQFLP